MNQLVIDILKKDHRKVETLFRSIKQNPQNAFAYFQELVQELEVHTAAEEIVLYPRAEQQPDLRTIANHSYEEHDDIHELLSEAEDLTPRSPEWRLKIDELEENVRHHVKEEEEDLFPRLLEIFSETQLHTLGRSVLAAKNRFAQAS